MSKASGRGKAHFVVDGAAVCSGVMYADGRPAMAPFLTTFVERRFGDHLCRVCRKAHPELCICGTCTPDWQRRVQAGGR